MPEIKPFPRATDDANPIVVDGALYNRIVATLEAAGKLSVVPPLRMSDGPGGKTISMRQPPVIVFVQISSQETAGGRYSGKIFQGPIDLSYMQDGEGFAAEDLGNLPTGDDAEIWNPADAASVAGNHSLDPTKPQDQIRCGIVIGVTTEIPARRIVMLFTDQPLQGGVKYQVLMTIDGSGNYGWDYPRFP